MIRSRTYTQEFKEEAIRLALETGCASETARQLGIPDSTLHTWIQKSRKDNVEVTS